MGNTCQCINDDAKKNTEGCLLPTNQDKSIVEEYMLAQKRPKKKSKHKRGSDSASKSRDVQQATIQAENAQ